MRIPKGEQIAGLSPAVVKRLVRQEQFDTPSAMKVLKLGEPRASEILAELCLQGWIDFTGTENFIDWWRCGPLGERLNETRILRRISYERGRAILQQVIARARESNAEPDHSRRITKIVLFGSLLDAKNQNIGDIDIAIECARRRLSAAEFRAIEKKEQMSAPQGLSFLSSLYWAETQLLRELRKVSHHISLHSINDIDRTGAAHQIVYAYDVETEQEIELTGETVAPVASTMDEDQDLNRRLPKSRALTDPVSWPARLDKPVEVTISQEQEDLAQHLWANGAPLKEVAQRCHLDPKVVRMYLAWQARGPIDIGQPPGFDPNLKVMIAGSFVGRGPAPTILADVSIRSGEASIEVNLWDEQEDSYTRIWSLRAHKAVRTRRDDLRRQAEVAYRTVVRWVEMIRPKVVGLNLHASVVLSSNLLDSTTSSGPRFPSLRSLAPVMCRALARDCSSECRKHPYDFRLACAFRSTRVDARLEVRKGGNDWRRVRSHPTTRRTVVETAIALLGVDPSWLNGFTKFEVDINGLSCETEPSVSEPETANRRPSL